MENLTMLEEKVMVTIPKENFYEEGFESVLWVNCFLDTLEDATQISPKQARGLLSSLAKKEYIKVIEDREGNTMYLLDNGINWLKENSEINLDDEGYAE